MIDRGLLASGVVVAVVAWVFPRVVRGPRRPVPLDPLLLSVVTAILIGRVVAVAVEDPTALRAVREVMVIRSGVAFWPALAGGVAAYAFFTRGSATSLWIRLSAAAPTVLAGYGSFEAMCLARDGCFGPAVSFGVTPPGLLTPMLPVGWIVAALTLGWAAQHQRRLARPTDVLSAILFLAVVRGVASFHLPRVGAALSSSHLQSIVVAVAALALMIGLGAFYRHTTPSRSTAPAPATTEE